MGLVDIWQKEQIVFVGVLRNTQTLNLRVCKATCTCEFVGLFVCLLIVPLLIRFYIET